MKKVYTSEEILNILSSISEFTVKNGYVEAKFFDSWQGTFESATSFIPRSFTRELLLLVEEAMIDGFETEEE